MGFKILTSAENEKIKLYRKLCSDKKARRSLGLFPLEGARLIRDAAAEKGGLKLVFATEKYAGELESLAEIYGSENIYMITEELAAKISDTRTPQGIFAVCAVPAVHGKFTEIIPNGRYIILDNLQDPGNMGTILRTADSLGIDGIACCNCCDLFSPKTVRGTMGSLLRVRTMCGEFEEISEMFRRAGLPIFSAVIDGDAEDIKNCDFSRGGAVIIGNEGSGIPREHITGKRITIKMHGNINSLNAAMAAGIIMWVLEAR
ncbi:MAG: RNA methyltransferase [Oscillospiraceae bacterium]|nr:RNA methyltransferase [Oscillospiraceae bacterium]